MELIQCGGSWWRHGLAGPGWRASRCRRVLEGRWRRRSCQSSMARVDGRCCGWCSEKEGWRSEGQEKERGGPRFLQRRQAGRGSHLPILSRPRTPPGLQVTTGTQKSAEVPWRPGTVLIYGRGGGPVRRGVPRTPGRLHTPNILYMRDWAAPLPVPWIGREPRCLVSGPGGATGRLTKTCDRRVSLWNSQARLSG